MGRGLQVGRGALFGGPQTFLILFDIAFAFLSLN
jgi:hypothetical protein